MRETIFFFTIFIGIISALNDELLSMMTLYFLAVILMSILVPTNVMLPPKNGCLLNLEVKCSGYSCAYVLIVFHEKSMLRYN